MNLGLPVKFFVFCTQLIPLLAMGQQDPSIDNLPLREFQGTIKNKPLVLYLTGDGGWNNFSQQLVGGVNSNGYFVVALDSRKYFWNAKTPEQLGVDVKSILEYYLKKWNLQSVLIVGYSFGADVSAFIPSRIPNSLLARLKPLILISPSHSSDFEIRLADLVGNTSMGNRKYNVEQAITESKIPVLCIFGEEEELVLRQRLNASEKIKIEILPGSHHYNNNTDLLIKLIETIR